MLEFPVELPEIGTFFYWTIKKIHKNRKTDDLYVVNEF